MMSSLIRQICVFSVFSGVVKSSVPKGGVKRAVDILIATELLCMIVFSFKEFDFEQYKVDLASLEAYNDTLIGNAEEAAASFNRRVIQEKYNAYIMDRACSTGTELIKAETELRWSTEGFWYPDKIVLYAVEYNEKFAGLLEAELGVEKSSQEWINE